MKLKPLNNQECKQCHKVVYSSKLCMAHYDLTFRMRKNEFSKYSRGK